MRKYHSLGVLVVLASTIAGCDQVEPIPQPDSLAFRHVTVIDATGSPARPGMTVVIDKGRIAAVGKDAEVLVPQSAQVFDGTGRFLIPGLVDMHVHTSWDQHFIRPLMIANGVTS